ncbi:MAG: tetratricopeptide repeat protein [Pseudohongiellaceae bacterium]|nr:tetratricopeptide repeat protein [Pseudohongiellaceae bacterium]
MKFKIRHLLLSLALASGVAHADYEDGVNAAQAGDYATALKEFQLAADAGLDLAQYNLAIMYYTGRGVEQNYQTAFEWTVKAAEQGHLNAQNNLGALYYTGTGTPVNFEKALQWYSAAAQGQHADAQYNLSTMYELGEGTEKDLVRAHFWAQAAQFNEHADAAELIERLAGQMTAAQISEARTAFAQSMLE